jgi:hypothetical protein
MSSPILQRFPLGFQWPTLDPFLFCVHHHDAYPRGDGSYGPAASLEGRDIGQDFAGKDGWRMYHGDHVPGFPQHPHRGFETVTIARQGFIDHSDSLGAAARFGAGDVQWLTAGRGIVHAEMFPLLRTDADNPVELFQIWLNLPAKNKMAEPHFTMLWREQLPVVTHTDALGKRTEVTVVAGAYADTKPLSPPPHSRASDPESEIAIWAIRLQAGATWTLPSYRSTSAPPNVAQASTNETDEVEVGRILYFFKGNELRVGNERVKPGGLLLRPDLDLTLEAGDADVEILMLQGRPIAEPVAQQGPFVMNTRRELEQAFSDYQRTRFGGWPWPDHGPVHTAASGRAEDRSRFARHPDGRMEEPEQA